MKKLTFLIAFSLLVLGAAAQTTDNSVRYNQYGTAVSRTPLTAESRDGILVFESANQKYKLWFDIRVQIDGAMYFGKKSYMDKIGNGITNRRTRFAIKAQLDQNWYGEIDTDFANGDFELKDAIIRYTACDWEFSLGNFKEDFSMEQTTSSRYLPFMERPMAVSAFSPSRHLGLDARFHRNWFYGSAGIFFQTIDNSETTGFVEDNNKDYGRNQGISTTAKVVFQPLYKHNDKSLHISLGGSYRTPKTDVAVGDYGGIRFDTRNSTNINRKKYIDTDVIENVDYNILYNAELAGHYKGLRFQAEYLGTSVHIKDSAPATYDKRTKVFGGWYAMAGVLLFGGQQNYNAGDAKFTQPTRGRIWGDIELLVRYDYLDLNDKNIYGGSGQNYTFGVNYYINNSVKLMVNYQYSDNDRYANGKGKLNIGYDAEGKPTPSYANVVADKGKGGVKYHMLGFRMEIDF